MRAVIYSRYSSDRQNDRSIEDQVAVCEDYCAREGLTVTRRYEDRALSGSSTIGRLGLGRLMQDARDGQFDVVVCESLDRLSRDQEDLAGIYKRLRFAHIEIRTVADGRAEDIHVGIKGLLGALYLKDLAAKTRRGLQGVARSGRSAGGRSYGYAARPGAPGELDIIPEEADTVRWIFERYIAGDAPRDIAVALNAQGIPGPRGGHWNGSTINGSRVRANGIICNSLYAGKLTWNRQRFEKDPDTGKRVSRPNPRAQWIEVDAPHLRLVEEDIWQAAQRRKARGSAHGSHAPAARTLFAGLLKCGCCGSSYIVGGSDRQRGRFLVCSRMRETGTCSNKRTIALHVVEAMILDGLQEQLCDQDLLADYVHEFRRAFAELQRAGDAGRAKDRTRLGEIERKIAAIMTVIEGGDVPKSIVARLIALEAERDSIAEDIQAADAPVSIELKPTVAQEYRQRIMDLRTAIAKTENERDRRTIMHEIRLLVEKAVIIPAGPYKPVEIDLYGNLAGLLGASAGKSVGSLVAGAGFEPTTFRL